MTTFRITATTALLFVTLACSSSPMSPIPLAKLPDINTDRVLTDIKKISSVISITR